MRLIFCQNTDKILTKDLTKYLFNIFLTRYTLWWVLYIQIRNQCYFNEIRLRGLVCIFAKNLLLYKTTTWYMHEFNMEKILRNLIVFLLGLFPPIKTILRTVGKRGNHFYSALPARSQTTAWKVSIFGAILVRIFPYFDWIWGDTEYLSESSPNAEKCGPEQLRIWTLLRSEHLVILQFASRLTILYFSLKHI